jgi:DNA primase
MFHCFGCGEGGDIFKFLMKMESVSFFNAVQILGDRLGISIPLKGKNEKTVEEGEEKKKIRKIHDLACDYYHGLLLKNPGAEKARNYLKSRGINEEMWVNFSLGFSLPQWSDLMIYLERKGFKRAELELAGLVLSGQHGFYDRFRGRVIFPIFDSQNRVVGFGGRVLDDSTPKYLNSPETVLFQKGKHLYGFGRAKGSVGRNPFIVVEGYVDVITGHQFGVNNMVGSMGTALTSQQLQQMGRFSKEVILVFDSDLAGQKAAMRGGELFLGSDWRVRVVSLPEGEDPDSFLRRVGKEAFEKRLDQGIPLMEFLIQGIIGKRKGLRIEEKIQKSRQLFPYITKLTSQIERSHYIKKIAEFLEVSEQDLIVEFFESYPKTGKRKQTPYMPKAPTFQKDEEMICHLLLHGEVEAKRIRGILEGFSDTGLKKIIKVVLDIQDQSGCVDIDQVVRHFSGKEEEEGKLFSQLMVRPLEYDDIQKTAEDCLTSIRRRWIQKQLENTEKAIESAEKEGDLDAVRNLQKNFIFLKQSSHSGTPYTRQAGVV